MSRQAACGRAPVTVVASGELSVVHQKMHRLSRNACEADTSRKTCARPSRPGPQLEAPIADACRLRWTTFTAVMCFPGQSAHPRGACNQMVSKNAVSVQVPNQFLPHNVHSTTVREADKRVTWKLRSRRRG